MEHFIAEIDGFCARNGMSESQFGTLALNDKNFIPQVRTGRNVGLVTARKVSDWMNAFEAGKAA